MISQYDARTGSPLLPRRAIGGASREVQSLDLGHASTTKPE